VHPPDDGRAGNGVPPGELVEVMTPPRWENPRKPAKSGKKQPPRAVREARLLKAVQESVTRQYHDAFRRLRRSLGQVGATVVRVNDGDPVRLILERLDRLRGMRSRR
jgi:hypothetical protein